MTDGRKSLSVPMSLCWAALAVGLMLLGRWTPDRLFSSDLAGAFWIAKIAALMLLAFIVALPRATGAADRRLTVVGVFLILVVYIFASYLWNPSTTVYAEGKAVDLAYNIAVLVTTAFGLTRPMLRQAFWPVLVGALGVMALIGLVMLPTALTESIDGRLSVLGGGPNIFARNMGILIIACLYFGLNFPKVRIICAALAGAAIIGMVGSGSRGGMAAWILGTVALFALDPACRRFVLTRPLIMAIFALVGGAALLLADLSVVTEIGSERFVQQTLEGGYLSQRDVLFQWAYSFWLEAPFFGNGLGSFSLISDLEYPHNILMEFLSETGAVGLLMFLVFAGIAGHRQLTLGGGEKNLVIPMIVLLGVAALASGDFVDSRVLFLFMLYPVRSMRRPHQVAT